MDLNIEEIIESLYDSDMVVEAETSTKYNELRHQYNELYNNVKDEEVKNQLNELNELKNQMDSESNKAIFKKGFSIGVKLIIGALNTK